MLYVVGGNKNTPVKKVTNAGGKTTLVQDPSNRYKGPDLNKVNVNAKTTTQPTTTPKTTTSVAAANPAPAPVETESYYEGGGGENSFDWYAYFQQLAAERQKRADEAYQRNMQRIADAYNSATSNLKSNYDSTADRLGASRDTSLSDVNKDAEASLRQAYINNMLTRKNLDQRLSAMGYNGGASETTMAQLDNNYGNSRNSINETLNNNISSLNENYGDNLANALQQYNDAVSNLDMQKMQLEMEAEQQRQNAMEGFYSQIGSLAVDPSYLTALQTALTKMGNYSYSPTLATNSYTPATVQQANSASNDANYAKYLAQARLDSTNGANANTIKNNLFGEVSKGNLDINSLYSILKQLGVY